MLNKSEMAWLTDEFLVASGDAESAMIVVALDNYKRCVDDYGIAFVDIALGTIGRKLEERLCRDNVIIGRVLTNAYAVFVKNADEDTVRSYIEIIDNLYYNSYMGSGKRLVSCKVGVSRSHDGCGSYADFMHKAHLAMYAAQRQHIHMRNYDAHYEADYPDYKSPEYIDYVPISKRDYDSAFIAAASGLMSGARNIESSLNLLVEAVSMRFDIDETILCEFDPENHIMHEKVHWDRSKGFLEMRRKIEYTDWDGFMAGFDTRGFMTIEDTEADIFSEKDKEFFRLTGVRSGVNCLLYKDVNLIGYVSFCDKKSSRTWSDYEKNTFYELGKLIALFVGLIIERRAADSETTETALDPLTGLMAYRRFVEKAQEHFARTERDDVYAILYMDINNFAYVNENFGFFRGNQVLRSFGDELKSFGIMATRASADRFIVYMRVHSVDDMLNEVENLNRSFTEIMRKKYPVSDLRVATGVYIMHPREDDISSGIENANLARKIAKETRDTYYSVFTEEMKEKKKNELAIIGGIHNAIRRGEIEAFLQPKYSLKKHEVVGAEALARWKKPDGTYRSPAEFMEPLERVGYIVDMDFCIFGQVLEMLAKWQSDGKKLVPISVNFSRMHMKRPDFVNRVIALANQYNIPKKYIELEITETVFTLDEGEMMKSLETLRGEGFIINIDDFGTGYSSLDLLFEVPVDVIKIDKSFIDKSSSKEGKRYIKQVADLVSASGKDIIFEGVETSEQAEFLLESGYSTIQGYYFSRPIPVREFEQKYIYNDINTDKDIDGGKGKKEIKSVK